MVAAGERCWDYGAACFPLNSSLSRSKFLGGTSREESKSFTENDLVLDRMKHKLSINKQMKYATIIKLSFVL